MDFKPHKSYTETLPASSRLILILFMKDIYKYIYYRIYTWNNYLWKNDEMSAFNSTLALTFSEAIILECLHFLIELFIDSKIPSLFDNFYIGLGIVGLIFLVNYFFLEHNKKYLRTSESFNTNRGSKAGWWTKGFLVFLITIGPIVFYLFVL